LPPSRADKPQSGFWGAGELSARKNQPQAIAYTDLLCRRAHFILIRLDEEEVSFQY
jgi:hypothetical protein